MLNCIGTVVGLSVFAFAIPVALAFAIIKGRTLDYGGMADRKKDPFRFWLSFGCGSVVALLLLVIAIAGLFQGSVCSN